MQSPEAVSNIDEAKPKKTTIAFKHGASVKTHVFETAKRTNMSEATVCRLIFNRGLVALYNLKIENNEIIG